MDLLAFPLSLEAFSSSWNAASSLKSKKPLLSPSQTGDSVPGQEEKKGIVCF